MVNTRSRFAVIPAARLEDLGICYGQGGQETAAMETHRAGTAAEGKTWSKRQRRNIPLPQPALCPHGPLALLSPGCGCPVPTASPAECRAP